MSKVNYHGLKIQGIRKVSLGCNSWTEYHDGNVIKICNTSRHMTMQEISDAIYEAVRFDAMCSAGCQAV